MDAVDAVDAVGAAYAVGEGVVVADAAYTQRLAGCGTAGWDCTHILAAGAEADVAAAVQECADDGPAAQDWS